MGLSYSLFKGASIQLDAIDLDPHHASTKIASLTSVKNVWPVRYFQHLANGGKRTFGDSYIGNLNSLSKHSMKAAAENDIVGYAPHVITQVDKLHAEGFAGKGIRIGRESITTIRC